MDSIKRVLNFILFGNIFVAVGASCLVLSSCIQLRNNNHLFYYSILVFFATLFIYNFQRIFYKPQIDKSLHSIRRKWIFENQNTIKLLALIGFLGVAITFFFNDFKIIFYLSPLLLISIAYFAPQIKLRKNPWFKLLTLVSVWTMVTAVVPILLNSEQHTLNENILHILLRFCFMIAICIPFDIRDFKIDKADDVKTLPHVLGENQTRWLALLFMFFYIFLIVLENNFGMINIHIFIGLILSAFINTILVFMSSSKQSEYFFVAALDGTMILQGIFLLMIQYLL